MKTGFLFLLQTIYQLASCVQIPRAIGAFYHVWKWHNVQRARSEMRRCTTHILPIQVMTTGPLLAPSKCKAGLPRITGTCPVGGENKVSGYGYSLWCGFKWGPNHATSQRSRLESQHQSVTRCAEESGDPLAQTGGRWEILGVAAGLGAGPQVQRNPGLASEGVLRLCTLPSLPPPPPTWTCWNTSFGHTSRTSPTWPPTTPKPAWSPPSAEYSPSSRWRLWKRHAPTSGSVSRLWLSLKAALLNRCQLYYIIKLPELIFSIKVLR